MNKHEQDANNQTYEKIANRNGQDTEQSRKRKQRKTHEEKNEITAQRTKRKMSVLCYDTILTSESEKMKMEKQD